MPSSLQFVPRKVRKTVRAPGTQGGTALAQDQLPVPAQLSSKSVDAAPEQAEYPRDVLLRVRLIAHLPKDELEEAPAASDQRWRARLEGRIRRRLERACSHTVEYVDILDVSVVGAGASGTKVQDPMQGVRVECIVRCASPESAKRLCSSVTAANDKSRGGGHGQRSGNQDDTNGEGMTATSDVETAEHTVSSQYIEIHPLQAHEQAEYWSKVPTRIQRRASVKSGRSRSAR